MHLRRRERDHMHLRAEAQGAVAHVKSLETARAA
eukprot:CAMPEP_0181255252 /NCGR_PEP_ID=MMETSP1096-20121128/49050_1 /TAXON_ID=156174 ORGANISM="Chrysochromulina ericina, Strain CCMP281" /NCGR_SAMPLE_ID=MMETSP1096 /ASSEMBLY_ACC=CAM_ASM_000453 /LENGTH=33 /DNA_ID= /DNA_START= /DNA_END= /DNA_ORIENTATION=